MLSLYIRIAIFKKIELELIAILIGYETELPFMPNSRCAIAINWYNKQSLHHITSMASFVEILKIGDEKFMYETSLLRDKMNMPYPIQKVFSQIEYKHFKALAKQHN